jgi:hypothetical protein
MNIGKRVRRQSILHPICMAIRTTLDNMVLILLFAIVAAILVAFPRTRNRIGFGGWTRFGTARENIPIARKHAEKSKVAGPIKQFFVVVLPDGTIATPRVAGQW